MLKGNAVTVALQNVFDGGHSLRCKLDRWVGRKKNERKIKIKKFFFAATHSDAKLGNVGEE
jgi:hypothetical protein